VAILHLWPRTLFLKGRGYSRERKTIRGNLEPRQPDFAETQYAKTKEDIMLGLIVLKGTRWQILGKRGETRMQIS